jgi:hypothetical protein
VDDNGRQSCCAPRRVQPREPRTARVPRQSRHVWRGASPALLCPLCRGMHAASSTLPRQRHASRASDIAAIIRHCIHHQQLMLAPHVLRLHTTTSAAHREQPTEQPTEQPSSRAQAALKPPSSRLQAALKPPSSHPQAAPLCIIMHHHASSCSMSTPSLGSPCGGEQKHRQRTAG